MASDDTSFIQKAAPSLVAALLLAAVGGGIGTWHLADNNAKAIAELKGFMSEGRRCTRRDCDNIELDVAMLRDRLRQHTEMTAHREAGLRMEKIEEIIRLVCTGPCPNSRAED